MEEFQSDDVSHKYIHPASNASQIAVAPHARVGSGSCRPANRRRLRFAKIPRDDAKKPVASPGIPNQVSKRSTKSYCELLPLLQNFKLSAFKLSAFSRRLPNIVLNLLLYFIRVVATLKIEIDFYLLLKIFNQDLLFPFLSNIVPLFSKNSKFFFPSGSNQSFFLYQDVTC